MIRRSSSVIAGAWFVVTVALFLGLAAAWVGDWRLEVVTSGSMAPTIPRRSVAIVRPVGQAVVHEGMVISFHDPFDRRRLILHRVISVEDREDGKRFYRTQGDANDTPDPVFVNMRDVRGRLFFHVPKLGHVLWWLRPPTGAAVLVGVPLAYCVVGFLRRRAARDSVSPKQIHQPGRRARSGSARSPHSDVGHVPMIAVAPSAVTASVHPVAAGRAISDLCANLRDVDAFIRARGPTSDHEDPVPLYG